MSCLENLIFQAEIVMVHWLMLYLPERLYYHELTAKKNPPSMSWAMTLLLSVLENNWSICL